MRIPQSGSKLLIRASNPFGLPGCIVLQSWQATSQGKYSSRYLPYPPVGVTLHCSSNQHTSTSPTFLLRYLHSSISLPLYRRLERVPSHNTRVWSGTGNLDLGSKSRESIPLPDFITGSVLTKGFVGLSRRFGGNFPPEAGFEPEAPG